MSGEKEKKCVEKNYNGVIRRRLKYKTNIMTVELV